MGKSEISDAKKSLQKTVGLGHKPNVVPDGPASINGDPRKVEIGWHPVAGSAGKWFADSIIGAKIQERTKNYPGLIWQSVVRPTGVLTIKNRSKPALGCFSWRLCSPTLDGQPSSFLLSFQG
jgi:hypothetical protein